MLVLSESGRVARPADQHALFRVLNSLIFVRTQEQFQRWTLAELQHVFPHGMLICGIGKIAQRGIQVQRALGLNFPMGYLEDIKQPDGCVASPVVAKWCRENRPQLFEQGSAGGSVDPDWLAAFRRYGLRNIAAHGLRSLDGALTSYFSFSRIPGRLTSYHGYVLELLVPHMHLALARALGRPKPWRGQEAVAPAPNLTGREREILHWLREGKTNWEIGRLLGLGEETVKTHVRHILQKLNVKNRAQAAAKAAGYDAVGEEWQA